MTAPDTEKRLRNYLQAKAGVVPEYAAPPDRLPPPRRRTWPVLVAAASIAAVLTVAASLLLRPVPPPPAGGLSSLRVPYITVEGQTRQLHDGTTTVPLAGSTFNSVVGRVRGGWLGHRWGLGPTNSHAAVLTPSGEVIVRGPGLVRQTSLSPDRTKAALLVHTDTGDDRIAVIDLASGKELHSLPLTEFSYLQGWNSNGIWYDAQSAGDPAVWQPGAQPREVDLGAFEAMRVYGTTDRMIVQTRQGAGWCLRVVTMDEAGKRTTLREHCGTSAFPYPELSPDGRVVVVPEEKVAIAVDGGQEVALPDLQDSPMPTGTVFEDERHFLALSSSGGPTSDGEVKVDQLLTRCDVVTGDCEKVYEKPWSAEGTVIELGQP
jgi:hypothetical protein